MNDKRIFNILVCPLCKKNLNLGSHSQELVCTVDKLVFPIVNGIPVLLESEATAWQET